MITFVFDHYIHGHYLDTGDTKIYTKGYVKTIGVFEMDRQTKQIHVNSQYSYKEYNETYNVTQDGKFIILHYEGFNRLTQYNTDRDTFNSKIVICDVIKSKADVIYYEIPQNDKLTLLTSENEIIVICSLSHNSISKKKVCIIRFDILKGKWIHIYDFFEYDFIKVSRDAKYLVYSINDIMGIIHFDHEKIIKHKKIKLTKNILEIIEFIEGVCIKIKCDADGRPTGDHYYKFDIINEKMTSIKDVKTDNTKTDNTLDIKQTRYKKIIKCKKSSS
jgi:hypothetical protein